MPLESSLDNYLIFELGAANNGREIQNIVTSLAAAATGLACGLAHHSWSDRQSALRATALSLFEQRLSEVPLGILIVPGADQPVIQDSSVELATVLHPLELGAEQSAALNSGSIFSIYRFRPAAEWDGFCGNQMLAAGIFVYGAQTRMLFSCGKGTQMFGLRLDSGEFCLSHENIRIPEFGRQVSIDAANYRFWDSNVRHYVDDCVAGAAGPLGVDYSMRWNNSLLVEAIASILHGGVYLYPDDRRPGYESGKHSLLHEALPLAFLVEQAGGKASDGYEAITDKQVNKLGTRVPLIFGAVDAVDQVLEYYRGDPTATTRFPLFENRSLFRN